MLFCGVCGQAAVLEVKDADASEVLCWNCLRAYGTFAGFGEFVEGFHRRPKPTTVCPHCEWTVNQIETTGLVGCPLCYVALKDAVNKLIRQFDGA